MNFQLSRLKDESMRRLDAYIARNTSDAKKAYRWSLYRGRIMTIDEIKAIVIPIVEPYHVKRVILFGSYARGEQGSDSDIDLIIDSTDELSYWDLLGLSGDVMRKMPIKADVWGLSEIKKPELLANIANEGVVIYER